MTEMQHKNIRPSASVRSDICVTFVFSFDPVVEDAGCFMGLYFRSVVMSGNIASPLAGATAPGEGGAGASVGG